MKENVTEMTFDCASEALEAIINFAYEGTMTMTSENLLLCLKASLELKLEEVSDNIFRNKFKTSNSIFCFVSYNSDICRET